MDTPWIRKCWRKVFAYSRRHGWAKPLYWLMYGFKYVLLVIMRACAASLRPNKSLVRTCVAKLWHSRNLVHMSEVLAVRRLCRAVKLGVKAAGTPEPVEYRPAASGQQWPAAPGAYVRLDYWAPLLSGGSYGHTCFVAKELNALSPGLKCAMAHKYPLLDEMGITQSSFPAETERCDEASIIIQGQKYASPLLEWTRQAKPSFIYERVCLGTLSAASVAKKLNIPYFAEYNGSEIEMRHSYDHVGMAYENIFIEIEDWSLKQATVISVVSEQIKLSLVKRGFDPARICVNPNGVDVDVYCPLPAKEKNEIREELGFKAEDVVLCFIGTFGGWHGVEVLAEVMPRVIDAVPEAKFFLIGDGNFKYLIDDAVAKHGLDKKVVCTGRMPQMQARRLLQAADIYLSPHSGHMKNMPFFGSPTKLFEYMALGGAIVASDLEQIGQVLRPALFIKDLASGHNLDQAGDARAILCTPGDIKEFADACILAAKNTKLREAMGRNARNAAKEFFTWEKHVERLWRFAAGDKGASWETVPQGLCASEVEQNLALSKVLDQAALEAQKQWNTNPCGAVDGLEKLDLDYFLRVEENRYKAESFIPKVFPFAEFTGKKVLEIGCGHGTDSAQFAKHGALCHVIDITDRHLELTRRNFELRNFSLDWKKCDAAAIDYPDEYFDCVYSYGVVHHIPNVERVLQEVRRVLKPGGKVCLAVYNKFSAFHIFSKILNDGLVRKELISLGYKGLLSTIESGADGISIRPYVRLYGKREFERMLRRNGFIIQTSGVNNLIGEHFSRWSGIFWPRWQKYENKLGWYVHAQATKPQANESV